MMNGFTVITVLAGLGSVASYTSGIRAKIYEKTADAWSSSWVWRIVFLGAAFVTALAALLSKIL